jgi:Restriction endonuclease S subunits
LGDVCDTNIGTLSSKEDCLIDYVDISSVDNQKKEISSYKVFKSSEAPSRARQLIQKNDVLVSTVRPNLNAVAMVTTETPNVMVASTGFCVLRSKEALDNNYLFHFTKSKTFINSLVKAAKGASYPAVSNADVYGTYIPLPPVKTQQRIANELGAVYVLLQLRKRQLEELDQLIKSVFYEMFGDPVTNEKGWTVHVLGELITNLRYGTSTPPIFSDAGYCFIRATNIKLGRIISRDMRFIDENEATKLEKCKLHYGDLIIVRSGVNTGDSCVVLEEYAGHYAGYDIIVSPDFTAINPVFINELINTSYMDRIIKPLTRRAAQPHLNAEQVKNLPIITPPLSLQEKFAEIVDQIESQKSLVKQAIDETQRLFDSLMSKYFDD